MLDAYTNRDLHLYRNKSLHEYFDIHRKLTNKKPAIPHYVGVSGYPCFPVSQSYARHVLIVYKPWTTYPPTGNNIPDFNDFIKSNNCPKSARLTYDRVLQRFLDKTVFVDLKAKDVDHSSNPMTEEDRELLAIVGLAKSENLDYDSELLKNIHRGEDFNWSKEIKVTQNHLTTWNW